MNRIELAKLKKQATQIATLKGQDIDILMGEFLQKYVQDNIGAVLEDYSKLKENQNKHFNQN
jgi:hypothetical protein